MNGIVFLFVCNMHYQICFQRKQSKSYCHPHTRVPCFPKAQLAIHFVIHFKLVDVKWWHTDSVWICLNFRRIHLFFWGFTSHTQSFTSVLTYTARLMQSCHSLRLNPYLMFAYCNSIFFLWLNFLRLMQLYLRPFCFLVGCVWTVWFLWKMFDSLLSPEFWNPYWNICLIVYPCTWSFRFRNSCPLI